MPTVPLSEGQSHFFKGCPSKDLRISIVVPPMDVAIMTIYGNVSTLYGNVPTFDPQIPLFFTDVSLLLVLGGWQLCDSDVEFDSDSDIVTMKIMYHVY